MPLRDHFHPPLSERRPWESFRTSWAGAVADTLNGGLLPPGFIALEQIRAGAAIEIHSATFVEPGSAPLTFPAVFPEGCTVEIVSTEGARTLVAAVELVSPGNKDRTDKRRLFAAKCATYLSRGLGLVVIDVVTSRLGNLHDELLSLLGLDAAGRPESPSSLYVAAYRPLRREGREEIDAWPMTLALGEPLPTVPLSLSADLCIPLDLEAAYRDACRRRHVDEVV